MRIIIFGTGSAALDLLSVVPETLQIVGLMDNDESRHHMVIMGHTVFSPVDLGHLDYDYVVIAARAVDEIVSGLTAKGVSSDKIVAFYSSYSNKLNETVNRDQRILTEKLGLALPRIGLATMYLDRADRQSTWNEPQRDSVRDEAFRLAARQVTERGVAGAVAELGVFQGDQAKLINELFPDRLLFLFDTFSGFDENDLGTETSKGFSSAAVGHFANTSMALVMKKMRHPQNVILCPGYFPESASKIEEIFAFVSLDVDLYEPTLAGLEWFHERLSPGGFIFVHDYNNRRYLGVRAAVDEFVEKHRAACVPLPDFAGSMIIAK